MIAKILVYSRVKTLSGLPGRLAEDSPGTAAGSWASRGSGRPAAGQGTDHGITYLEPLTLHWGLWKRCPP